MLEGTLLDSTNLFKWKNFNKDNTEFAVFTLLFGLSKRNFEICLLRNCFAFLEKV